MNNVLQYLSTAFALIPTIVAGIQAIHGEKDVATKTQLAQDSLTLATGAAEAVLPQADSATIQTVSGAVSSAITSAVQATQAIATASSSTQS